MEEDRVTRILGDWLDAEAQVGPPHHRDKTPQCLRFPELSPLALGQGEGAPEEQRQHAAKCRYCSTTIAMIQKAAVVEILEGLQPTDPGQEDLFRAAVEDAIRFLTELFAAVATAEAFVKHRERMLAHARARQRARQEERRPPGGRPYVYVPATRRGGGPEAPEEIERALEAPPEVVLGESLPEQMARAALLVVQGFGDEAQAPEAAPGTILPRAARLLAAEIHCERGEVEETEQLLDEVEEEVKGR